MLPNYTSVSFTNKKNNVFFINYQLRILDNIFIVPNPNSSANYLVIKCLDDNSNNDYYMLTDENTDVTQNEITFYLENETFTGCSDSDS